MTTTPNHDDLPEYLETFYNVTDHGTEWHVDCKRCWRTWTAKKGPLSEVNLATLMHHAHSHQYNRA